MPSTEPIVTPIIHPNGDRRETLMARLEAAMDAVSAAMDTLRACAPNGRNFYPEAGRMTQADAQHRARQAHLQAVYDSLEQEAIQIDATSAT